MHFAYPPRKSSNPTAYIPRSTKLPGLRKNRLKYLAIGALAFFLILFLFTRPSRRNGHPQSHTPSGNPPVVIVTVLDDKKFDKQYLEKIKENRILYAQKHGYETFFPRMGEYGLNGSPGSWTKVVAMRHALTKFPDCRYGWYLDQDAFIMNPSLSIEDHVMQPRRLESLMIKDMPVVPPDSIIRTFGHLKGQDVDFVLTQDNEGLSVGSFVIRNGDWANFFLETWFDPIYRSYNFQKAELHALEHIVQWHPTILSKLAFVPQNILNSYNGLRNSEYQTGDLVVRFLNCAQSGPEACEGEAKKYEALWRASFKST